MRRDIVATHSGESNKTSLINYTYISYLSSLGSTCLAGTYQCIANFCKNNLVA